ncbi:hypothetical protein F5B22DRAFT_650635 [Xylaria bambusicola]|uniref:uncharacterized protein n=1 Tax=Xylaria bambusicola TaxID=326684 RepID=UPI00200771E5|nr:uncharacterized protein F5B22DRAFT_650635 [Xylaria bambusicola]KAI0506522.1 hypothetical protein F5B22DRAFT_650635 [Xylaria bambusicola]
MVTSMAFYNEYEDWIYDLPTIRALIQVSREARKVVLAGRQLHRFKADNTYETHSFRGGVCYMEGEEKKHPILHKFFYVNWDIDMFYFRRGKQRYVTSIFDAEIRGKIKHIAIEINGPAEVRRTITAPNYDQLCDEVSPFPAHFFTYFLPSLKTVYLAMSFYAVHRSCAHIARRPLKGLENSLKWFDEDFDMEIDEDQMSEHYRILDTWFTADFGFHHVDTFSVRYWRHRMWYSPGLAPDSQHSVQREFKHWVKEMVSLAKEEAAEELRQLPKFKMVMDHNGAYEAMIEGYNRSNVGLRPNSEFCSLCAYGRR